MIRPVRSSIDCGIAKPLARWVPSRRNLQMAGMGRYQALGDPAATNPILIVSYVSRLGVIGGQALQVFDGK